jgi:hypothetical protein
MGFTPVPATEGLKYPVNEFTPGPEYVPPRGMPPFSLNGWALRLVTVSWQTEKLTEGVGVRIIVIVLERAGLPCGQLMSEVSVQFTWSPDTGV